MDDAARLVGAVNAGGVGQGTRFQLGEWVVEAATNRLLRNGHEERLEEKMMAVLCYLVSHAGELVQREVLEQAIWGETVVGDDALTGCIAKLRRALGDDPRQPRYIETISKKGYRLIAEPGAVATPGYRNKPSRRRRLGMLLLPAVVILGSALFIPDWHAPVLRTPPTDRPAIVVLAFTNLGEAPSQDYFSDGITTDIRTALSKLSGLLVISRAATSGEPIGRTEMKDLAGNLGVRYLLQGSVRRADGRLRVNVQLIDAERDTYLWSENYDRQLHDIFAVQDDITAHIVSTLSVQLTQDEQRRTARLYTVSLDAYDDFLRGQALYIHHTADENQQARAFFQQALLRDPGFARAYSAMALTYVAAHRYGWDSRADNLLQQALAFAQKGVELDRDLPQAYWVLGYIHLFRQEYEAAAEAAHRAVDLNPNYADSYLTLAICRIHAGRPGEAVQLARKAMLLYPEYPAAYASILGQSYFYLQNYEHAATAFGNAIDRNMNLPTPYVFLIVSLSKLNRLEEARWAALQFRTVAPAFRVEQVAEMLPLQDADGIEDMKRHLRRVDF